MDYFTLLNLSREPFSNSPDPDFFFHSRQHTECLQRLELSIRLRRGLNIVIGDVGTGKTTLCRQLIRRFAQDETVDTHLILDPGFGTPSTFLFAIAEMLEGSGRPDHAADDWQIKEIIKQHLFRKGVDEKKIVVLIIDEGQKIPEFCLEILREFLNYETNAFKLLQIVIFAQKELAQNLDRYPNFSDRINLTHPLGPMNFADTKAMIRFRLDQSGRNAAESTLFTFAALWAVYRKTRGYPRRIINLCHRCLLTVIIQNRSRVDWFTVRSCAQRYAADGSRAGRRLAAAAVVAVLLLGVAAAVSTEKIRRLVFGKGEVTESAGLPQHKAIQPAPTPIDEPRPMAALKQSIRLGHPTQAMDKEPPPAEEPAGLQTADTPVENSPVTENGETMYEMPATLGAVMLGHNQTLWGLIKTVYGAFDRKRFQALERANPSIKNPNRLKTGQRVYLPAIPAAGIEADAGAWRVELGKTEFLESAMDMHQFYRQQGLPVRLIPHWNSREGLQFSLLLEERFSTQADARSRLGELPLPLRSAGTVRKGWGEGVVFFADPGIR